MAIYSRSEFCELVGLHSKNLSVYIGRGALIMSGKTVDTSISLNAEFLEKRKDFLKLKEAGIEPNFGNNQFRRKSVIKKEKPEKPAPVESKKKKVKKPVKSEKVAPKDMGYQAPDPVQLANAGLKARIETMKLQKLQLEIDAAEFKKQLQMGKFVPSAQVKIVFKHLGQTFVNSYRNGFENILEEFIHKYKISHEDMIRLKQKTVAVINSSHDHAIKSTQRSLFDIIKEQTKSPDHYESEDNEDNDD